MVSWFLMRKILTVFWRALLLCRVFSPVEGITIRPAQGKKFDLVVWLTASGKGGKVNRRRGKAKSAH